MPGGQWVEGMEANPPLGIFHMEGGLPEVCAPNMVEALHDDGIHVLLYHAQRPDLLEAGACDVPYDKSAQRPILLEAGACWLVGVLFS